ncbi:hypothetical protein [Mesorhizobium sp.]|nr:hypothetical protein [Mesorhizobium sp.]
MSRAEGVVGGGVDLLMKVIQAPDAVGVQLVGENQASEAEGARA